MCLKVVIVHSCCNILIYCHLLSVMQWLCPYIYGYKANIKTKIYCISGIALYLFCKDRSPNQYKTCSLSLLAGIQNQINQVSTIRNKWFIIWFDINPVSNRHLSLRNIIFDVLLFQRGQIQIKRNYTPKILVLNIYWTNLTYRLCVNCNSNTVKSTFFLKET